MTLDLGAQFSGSLFAFFVVATRLSGFLLNFPGLSESFVPTNVRLAFILVLSFLLCPVLAPAIGAMPAQIPALVLLLAQELLIGLFFGFMARLLMSVVETAGTIVGIETGLSNAMVLNPTQAAQSALPSAFLGLAATALVFITGLDHFLFKGILDSYRIMPVRGGVMLGDMVDSYGRLVSESFRVGVELATPFIVIGLVLFAVMGSIQRMLQQIQLFLVVLPLQIWGGLLFFSAAVGFMLEAWLRYFDRAAGQLFLR